MSHVQHQKLLEMPDSDENKTPQNSEENELAMYLLSWILQLIKGKVWELIENFQSLINDFFHSPKTQHVDPAVLHEKLRSSLHCNPLFHWWLFRFVWIISTYRTSIFCLIHVTPISCT
ncbi:hypothetical protein Ahy_B02g057182 [Arachis hypogaea]|uniref:Uncharacterized protein n=2 Tax=Arachis hypogaea TaxID=3818 RepID=A0A445AB60_ARAHY|nr:hypothetical protein Ahy_B02g057182 [Arachis hypogaea]